MSLPPLSCRRVQRHAELDRNCLLCALAVVLFMPRKPILVCLLERQLKKIKKERMGRRPGLDSTSPVLVPEQLEAKQARLRLALHCMRSSAYYQSGFLFLRHSTH